MFLSWVACRTPYSWLMAAGKGLGILYFKFIKKQRNRAVKQMMESLHNSQEEAEKLIRASFINMGKNFMGRNIMSGTSFRFYPELHLWISQGA